MEKGAESARHTPVLVPRLVRLRDAPAYLGMDRNKFGELVRPYVTEIPLGSQAVAFDRLDLDAWVDDYIQCNGRRPKALKLEDDACQRSEIVCRGSVKRTGSGKSKSAVNTQKADGSVKARDALAALKRKRY
jgi:predicted DNA-binding transcriptional regulator AlpA